MENLSDLSTIRFLCKNFGFEFSKSLGQNFLIDSTVCPRIAAEGVIDENSGVIEIGTGFGVLTAELCKKAKKVVAIEIDKKLIPVLNTTLSEFSNFKIINDDVLKVDLNELIKNEFEGMNVTVCANLPYYVTSPIIMKLLEERLPIDSITVMVQKEAAARLCAVMGTRACGAVTAAVRYYAEPQILFNVNRESFFPSPNVDSCVIKLTIHKEPVKNVQNEAFLFALIKSAFSQRRKTLANPVSAAFSISKEKVIQTLCRLSLKPTARAEELTMDEFVALSNELSKEKQQKI